MSLSTKEEEQLSEKVKEFPVLYDKGAKEYREKDAVNNAGRSVQKQPPEVFCKKRCS